MRGKTALENAAKALSLESDGIQIKIEQMTKLSGPLFGKSYKKIPELKIDVLTKGINGTKTESFYVEFKTPQVKDDGSVQEAGGWRVKATSILHITTNNNDGFEEGLKSFAQTTGQKGTKFFNDLLSLKDQGKIKLTIEIQDLAKTKMASVAAFITDYDEKHPSIDIALNENQRKDSPTQYKIILNNKSFYLTYIDETSSCKSKGWVLSRTEIVHNEYDSNVTKLEKGVIDKEGKIKVPTNRENSYVMDPHLNDFVRKLLASEK